MGSMGGDSSGRRKGKKYSNYQRPAEGKGMKRGKVPRGVQGHSLGGGAKRAKKGSSGCAVIALGGLSGLLLAVEETVRHVLS